jgi:hypothetical protein
MGGLGKVEQQERQMLKGRPERRLELRHKLEALPALRLASTDLIETPGPVPGFSALSGRI